MPAPDSHVIDILAVEVVQLEEQVDHLRSELRIAREMVYEALDLAHLTLLRIDWIQRASRRV